MELYKRYELLERDHTGRLICVGKYSTPEEFDQDIAKHPPAKGHTLTLFDSFITEDCFGLSKKAVRIVVGTAPVDDGTPTE